MGRGWKLADQSRQKRQSKRRKRGQHWAKIEVNNNAKDGQNFCQKSPKEKELRRKIDISNRN